MAVYRNKTGQKVAVFAVDGAGEPKTGDAAAITAQISKDGGACAATNDANPTELSATAAKGIYLFDLAQAESDADVIVISPVSATSGVKLRPVIIYTEPELRSLAAAYDAAKTAATQVSVDAVKTDTAAILDDTGTSGVVLPQAQADKVWGTAARSLTDKAGFALSAAGVQAIWEYGTRSLTTFGSLVADVATAVWGAGSRTLTGFGSLIADIWASANRTLTAFGFTPALDPAYDAAKSAASQASVNTLAGYVDTEVAAILAVAQKLDGMLELDGALYRFTANALENAPAGSGTGTADWTAGEKEQIRSALGVDGTKTAASGGQLQTLDVVADAIKTKTDTLPATPAAKGDIPTAAAVAGQVRTELTTELGRLDAAVSTRLATAGYTAPPTAAAVRAELDANSTRLAAIDGKTANLPSDPADQSLLIAATDAIRSDVAGKPSLAAIEASTVLAKQASVDDLEGRLTAQRAANLDNLDAAVSSRSTFDAATQEVTPTAASKTGYSLSAAGIAGIWAYVVEGTTTVVQLLRGLASALLGKVSGAGTAELRFRDLADSKDRIVAAVDENGNRQTMTRDLD